MLACRSNPWSFLLGNPSWQHGASQTHRWTPLGASAGGQVSDLPSCTPAISHCYPPSVGGLLHAWMLSHQLKCWENKGKIRVMLCQDSLALTSFCWFLSLAYFLLSLSCLPEQPSFYFSFIVVPLLVCLGPIPWTSHVIPISLPSLTRVGGRRSDPFL